MTDLPTTIHNERTKLTATYFNGAAIAVLAIGSFAPMIGYISQASSIGLPAVALIGSGCLAVSIGLHFQARQLLGKLK